MGNALVTHVPKDSTGYGPIGGARLNWFLEGLRSLLSKVRVPDAQFSLYLGDGCEAYRQRISVKPGVDDRALKSLSFDTDLGTKMLFPLVLCADRNESDTWGVWGPSRSMSEMLIRHGANHLQQVAANSTRLSPWAHKKNQAVWRGGTTGRGYTPEKWREEGRTKLANFSQRFPHLLDAGFTGAPEAVTHTILRVYFECGERACACKSSWPIKPVWYGAQDSRKQGRRWSLSLKSAPL